MNIQGNKPPDGQEVSRAQAQNSKPVQPERRPEPAAAPKEARKDRVEISRAGKEVAELKAAIENMPEVRAEKVKEIQKAVESGSYTVDPARIAEKLLNEL